MNSLFKHILWISSFCCLGVGGTQAQNSFKITGGHVKISGNYNLVLNNTQFVNDGNFEAGTSTASITGNSTDVQSAIAGTNSITFYNLQINKTTNGSQLQRAIQIDNELQMTSGNLDLNGNDCTLGTSNGTIIGESESSHITGVSGGFITKTVTLNAPTNINPGNLGSVLSSSANIGVLIIKRGHVPQTPGGNSGIARFFEFTHSNDQDLDLTAQIQYFDAELNGNIESSLGLWRQDSTFWFNPSTASADATSNFVRANNVNLLTKLTLAPAAPKLSLKVFLEGPYDTTNTVMNDGLRVENLVPTREPYTGLGYSHGSIGGGESINPFVFSITNNDAPVDWVMVELRTINNNIVLAARSALLQKDGDIVDLDGRSPLSFPGIASEGSYYVAIRHRNHLGIRTLNSVAMSQTPTSLDLTTGTSLVVGGANALNLLSSGVYGLFCGDFDANGQIQNTDGTSLVPTIGIGGYLPGDIDMNGQVQNTELQLKLTPNLGRGAQFSY